MYYKTRSSTALVTVRCDMSRWGTCVCDRLYDMTHPQRCILHATHTHNTHVNSHSLFKMSNRVNNVTQTGTLIHTPVKAFLALRIEDYTSIHLLDMDTLHRGHLVCLVDAINVWIHCLRC